METRQQQAAAGRARDHVSFVSQHYPAYAPFLNKPVDYLLKLLVGLGNVFAEKCKKINVVGEPSYAECKKLANQFIVIYNALRIRLSAEPDKDIPTQSNARSIPKTLSQRLKELELLLTDCGWNFSMNGADGFIVPHTQDQETKVQLEKSKVIQFRTFAVDFDRYAKTEFKAVRNLLQSKKKIVAPTEKKVLPKEEKRSAPVRPRVKKPAATPLRALSPQPAAAAPMEVVEEASDTTIRYIPLQKHQIDLEILSLNKICFGSSKCLTNLFNSSYGDLRDRMNAADFQVIIPTEMKDLFETKAESVRKLILHSMNAKLRKKFFTVYTYDLTPEIIDALENKRKQKRAPKITVAPTPMVMDTTVPPPVASIPQLPLAFAAAAPAAPSTLYYRPSEILARPTAASAALPPAASYRAKPPIAAAASLALAAMPAASMALAPAAPPPQAVFGLPTNRSSFAQAALRQTGFFGTQQLPSALPTTPNFKPTPADPCRFFTKGDEYGSPVLAPVLPPADVHDLSSFFLALNNNTSPLPSPSPPAIPVTGDDLGIGDELPPLTTFGSSYGRSGIF